MLREITIGQYYPAESKIHSLDPRVKLFATMIYIVSLFINETIAGFCIAALFLGISIKISKVPIKYIVKGLRTIVFLMLFSVIFTVFLTDGQILVSIGIFKITREGLLLGGKIVIRLLMLIIGSSLMTLTTTPTDIADGLEKAFRFLEYIKIPVHDIAMMMSIAFRFIPILTEETDKIMKAQMARGADFETGGLIKKAKGMIPLIIPLMVSAVKRALDLATAMEARCYQGGNGRTKMKPLIYGSRDYATYLILILYLVLMISVKNIL